MASGIIGAPEERTTQPQGWVPVASQFSRDMVVAHAGSSLEVRNPTTGAIDGVFTTMSAEPAGPPFVYADTIGLALDLTHDRAILSSNFADTDSFTVLTWLKPYASGLTALRTWFRRGSDSWGGWSIFFGNNSSGIPFIAVVLTAGGTTYYDAVGSSALSDTEWTAVAGTFDAASGVLKLFVNGVLAATTSTGNSVLRSSGFNLFMGGDTDSTGGNYFGRRGPMFVLKRAMSDAEVARYSANPWQIFEADDDPVFYSLASGSNNTATLSSTLDAATLTGVGNVTRSGTLAVTLDAATLAGIGTAAVTNKTGTLAVTLDAATLAGVGAVTRSGTLAVTLDAATLAGVGSVAVGSNREGTLASTLADATLAGIGGAARSATLAVTLDAATLAGVGTAGQPRTGTLSVTLDNVTLSGVGAIPAAPSTGGGKTTGSNLSRKQKKKLKAVESQEWLKAEETARQLLSDRFTKQTPQEKAEALQTYVESLQPVIEALKALTTQIEEVKEVVEDAPVMELTPHQEILSRFDTLEKKLKSVEELVIILMADL